MAKYKSEFAYSNRDFNCDDVENAIEFAVKDLRDNSYYGPYLDRYPILFGDKIPNMAKKQLNDHNSPACTDHNNVFLDVDNTADIVNRAIHAYQNLVDTDYAYDDNASGNLVNNIESIIAHEYTHIICQHKKVLEKFKTLSGPEQTCAILAADIEANRGHKVNKKSVVYKVGVTEDSFPETREAKFFPEIYAVLLNKYNEQQEMMEKLADAIREMMGDNNEGGEGESNGNSNNKKNGDKSDSGKGSVQGQPQAGDNSNNSSNDASTVNSGVNDKEDDKKADGKKWETLTKEKIEKSIKNANNVMEQVRAEVHGDETGIGLESPYTQYKPELTATEMLEDNYKRWNKQEIKKEFAKLKSVIKGNCAKNRVKTYARPSRRPISGSSTLIMKGAKNDKEFSPRVLIAMDSSGSMQSTTMKEVACAIENVFKDLGKPKAGSYICKHESNVSDVKPMMEWKKVVESYKPSGGNCFTKVVKKANELGVDVVINIGDGQDCVVRGNEMDNDVEEFKNNNRKWYDVLVTNKNENQYYYEEAEYDRGKGFDRECISLGSEIKKYLG